MNANAIDTYIRYGRSTAATVRALGYPSKKQLRRWYQSYVASGRVPSRKKRKAKYSSAERRRAVEKPSLGSGRTFHKLMVSKVINEPYWLLLTHPYSLKVPPDQPIPDLRGQWDYLKVYCAAG